MTHSGEERYITGIQNQTLIGYKYFNFDKKVRLALKVRGTGEGKILISDGKNVLGEASVVPAEKWVETSAVIETYGVVPLFMTYQGSGTVDFISFCFLAVD